MNVLLAIISHPKDNELVRRHWPYFKMTGFSMLGCGTEDGKCEWPESIPRLDSGKMGTRMTPAGPSIFGLVEQELDIWKYFLNHPEFDSVCVVEADNLFVRKPPVHTAGHYMVTVLPNCAAPGLFQTDWYASTPRWADRDVAASLYTFGYEMFKRGETEHDISDRFPALICERHGIPIVAQNAWSPSVAAFTEESWLREAKIAIKGGAFCLHSVKTAKQLEALKDLFPQNEKGQR